MVVDVAPSVVPWAATTLRGRPAAGPADGYRAGTRWPGDFRFRPPSDDYTGDVVAEITDRTGDVFRGVYATERGIYLCLIAGSVRGDAIRRSFTRAIRDNAEKSVVGSARVEGKISGQQIDILFRNQGYVADMRLQLAE